MKKTENPNNFKNYDKRLDMGKHSFILVRIYELYKKQQLLLFITYRVSPKICDWAKYHNRL